MSSSALRIDGLLFSPAAPVPGLSFAYCCAAAIHTIEIIVPQNNDVLRTRHIVQAPWPRCPPQWGQFFARTANAAPTPER